MRKSFLFAASVAAPLLFASCNGGGFKKTKSGIEYMIVKDVKGPTVQMGDMVTMTIRQKLVNNGGKDSVLSPAEKTSGNVPPLEYVKGTWAEGVMMMSAGDSAVFRQSVDTLVKLSHKPRPAWIRKGAMLQYEVKLISATPDPKAKEQMEQQMKVMDEMKKSGATNNPQQPQQPPTANPEQPQIDDKILQDYFAKNGLKPKKTASGLYYIIDNAGSGSAITPGQTVSVMYTGKTLDGKTFDSNEDPHKDPLQFPIGQGRVIPGWDEGVALAKKGGKIRLFIPSTLAYGPASQGPIAPNSILMFNVTVLDVK